jgi:hypothetical protein
MKLIDVIRTSIVETAARHAADVDERARFPSEALAALRGAGALSAASKNASMLLVFKADHTAAQGA